MREIGWREAVEAVNCLRDWLRAADARQQVSNVAAIEKVSALGNSVSQRAVVGCSTMLLDGKPAILILLDARQRKDMTAAIPDVVEGTQVRCCFVEG